MDIEDGYSGLLGPAYGRWISGGLFCISGTGYGRPFWIFGKIHVWPFWILEILGSLVCNFGEEGVNSGANL